MGKNYKFKKYLILIGTKQNKCERCGIEKWLEEEITFDLHHIDGNNENNDVANLQLLCPNCHSLTPNYRGRNKKKNSIKKPQITDQQIIDMIPQCYNRRHALAMLGLVSAGANYDRINKIVSENGIKFKEKPISQLQQKRLNTIVSKYGSVKQMLSKKTKIVWPERNVLEEMVLTQPLSVVGKNLGVSDNAVRKKCKSYGIDYSKNPWSQKHGRHAFMKRESGAGGGI